MVTIGIDIDGVIADLNTPMRMIYQRITGKKLITDSWHPRNGDGSEFERAALDAVFSTPFLWQNLELYEGAIAGVEMLSKLGDVFLHTCPPPQSPNFYAERVFWKHKYFKNIPLVITDDKGLLSADYFIDDRLSHLTSFYARNPDARLFLIRRDWSYEFPQPISKRRLDHIWHENSLLDAAENIKFLITGKYETHFWDPQRQASYYYEGVPDD